MVRFIGKNILRNNDTILSKELLKSNQDWYSQTFNDVFSKNKDGLTKYKLEENSDERLVRCLDLTDFDMSDSPLKRFHQITICGNYVDDTGKASAKNYIITAALPKSFSYNIKSNWGTPFKEFLNFSQYNGLVQGLTNGEHSSSFGLATMKLWESPNPLQIRVDLECLDDTGSGTGVNTLEAIDILSRWALPLKVNSVGTYTGVPGPGLPPVSINYNEYDNEGKKINTTNGTLMDFSSGQRLSVLVGGMLFLDYCILTDINVTYPNTKAQYLHDYNVESTFGGKDAGIRLLPVRCNISLTFETIIGLTHTNFQQMLSLRDNTGIKDVSTMDITGLQEKADVGKQTAGMVAKFITKTPASGA